MDWIYLVCLTLDAQVHDVVAADGAVVHHDVPGPQGHGVPLFHLKPLLVLRYKIDEIILIEVIWKTIYNVQCLLQSHVSVVLHEHEQIEQRA